MSPGWEKKSSLEGLMNFGRSGKGVEEWVKWVVCGEAGDVVKHTSDPALPGHLHISVPGAEGDSLIMLLDAAGVECSTGSACNAGVNRPSHVLLAMGVPEDLARGAVRFSLGHATTERDVDAVLAVVGDTVARAKAAGMA